ncbi:phosphonate ABC transporter substrate-binding protein, partial [Vibrio parahaemolyticus]|nr:phosphonate ABC transporter substrate-binding protein [Vibrio parahaemolyticus]
MKITVLGTRGIPDVLGGVETHCQHLYPQLVKQFGAEVCVIARSPYVPYQRSSYEGVQTKAIWAPKKKSLEAIVHS